MMDKLSTATSISFFGSGSANNLAECHTLQNKQEIHDLLSILHLKEVNPCACIATNWIRFFAGKQLILEGGLTSEGELWLNGPDRMKVCRQFTISSDARRRIEAYFKLARSKKQKAGPAKASEAQQGE
jgi:hypothetical protein